MSDDTSALEVVAPAQPMAAARRRRASARITLVLIGTASIAGCNEPDTVSAQRDLYEHRSKCVQDWGEERKCELITDGQHRGYWYGPSYSGASYGSQSAGAVSNEPLQPRGRNAVGAEHVTRSGFGSSAASHSSGS